ncbi:MAG TPA: lipoate protein ligase C-terminal domain-containing protein [Erysipelotrichaceae bacterium]|nr:lipoate protein ligase C-terminal domain-containing protein [Erysipelotrichaceae bacterium]
MVDVDKNKLAKYLTVSKEKLSGKHVSSVKSRVINLKEVNEKLTVEELKKALLESFEDYYQLSVETIVIDADRIKQLTQQYQKAEFIYGKNSSCSFHKSCRFVWGVVKISYSLKDNRISELEIASDCLDSSLPEEMQAILLNKQLDKNLYSYSERTEYQDIINLLLQEEYL